MNRPIAGTIGEDNGQSRLDGFAAALAGAGQYGIHHVPSEWAYDQSRPRVEAFLAEHPNMHIDAIFGLSDSQALSGALLLAYNQLRFGNPLDFGYLRQNVVRELMADQRLHGQFNLRYVPHNLWAMLLAGPVWNVARRQIMPTIDGMSVLLTTPTLIYLAQARQRSALAIGAWLALTLLLLPLLTYYNTGWWQFGYRAYKQRTAPCRRLA